jgi:CxxC-x17-CxxC domain-containing protein
MAYGSGGGFRRIGGFKGGSSFKRKSFGPRESHKITCSECGKEDTVPFKPREGTPVYCRDCFFKKKGITPRDKQSEEKTEEKTEATDDEESEEEAEEETEEY